MNRRALYPALLMSLGLMSACDRQAAKPDTDSPGARVEAPDRKMVFEGRVVPMKATELRAPQNVLKLSFMSNSSSWVKLVQLAPEGVPVKKGDVVGRFEFRHDRAKHQIRDNINQAKAELNNSSLGQQTTLAELRTDLKQLRITAQKAGLDVKKEGLVSERRLSLFRMDHKMARFEVNATTRMLGVQQRRSSSEDAFYKKKLEQAEAEKERFDAYKARFKVLAPHDGIVRHGYSRRRRRRLQKGDGMPAGYPFASLAPDRTRVVEFFVAEHQRAQVKIGDNVKVTSPTTGVEVSAEVISLGDFPQELGFLKENDELHNAREKAYVARARFAVQPEDLKSGVEIKVSY